MIAKCYSRVPHRERRRIYIILLYYIILYVFRDLYYLNSYYCYEICAQILRIISLFSKRGIVISYRSYYSHIKLISKGGKTVYNKLMESFLCRLHATKHEVSIDFRISFLLFRDYSILSREGNCLMKSYK